MSWTMTRDPRAWLPGRLLALGMAACSCTGAGGEAWPEGAATVVELPAPRTTGTVTVEGALAARRSVRTFTAEPLTRAELAQLLWAAQGVTHEPGRRTAPSAGALYPIELYAVTPDGLFHYQPDGHRLVLRSKGDLRGALAIAALDQECVAGAAAVFVVTGVVSRTAAKYGGLAERYVLLEAGHVGQNLALQAVALDLGAVTVGAFEDDKVQRALGLPADH
ncbi:MAG: SagB/ThcOx family dehydrogenase, partial [Deltaproteobacteria bacterium]|nr:SagB/ThcOx family dehydrogenase [Deltaproteobacteria bacterium]